MKTETNLTKVQTYSCVNCKGFRMLFWGFVLWVKLNKMVPCLPTLDKVFCPGQNTLCFMKDAMSDKCRKLISPFWTNTIHLHFYLIRLQWQTVMFASDLVGADGRVSGEVEASFREQRIKSQWNQYIIHLWKCKVTVKMKDSGIYCC